MAEAETPPTANMNYFLGISASTGVSSPTSRTRQRRQSSCVRHHRHPDQHHRLAPRGGHLRRDDVASVPRRCARRHIERWRVHTANSQHSARCHRTALNRNGNIGSNPQGFFHGLLDEVRIWNRARTQVADSGGDVSGGHAPASGLIGRWALNEAAGATVGQHREKHHWRRSWARRHGPPAIRSRLMPTPRRRRGSGRRPGQRPGLAHVDGEYRN